jgi:hypothetical protein
VAGQSTGRSPGRIARSILAVLFGVIGVIGVLASVVAVWAHQTVFSSSKVANAVDQALLNPEVNDALAVFLTDQVMDAVPLEDLVSERVPPELDPFVPVFVGGVQNVVHEAFTRVLEDGRAREALVALVERTHEAVMRVLEGDSNLPDAVTVEEGEVSLNLLPLLGRGLERIQDRGILTDVDLPELAPDGDPEEQIAALEEALDRDLPDRFGQLVVYSSDNLAKAQASIARAQDAFKLVKRSMIAIIALTVIALAASVALANQRRRAALTLLLSAFAALVVGRVLVRTVVEEAPSLAAKPGGRAALEEMVTSLTEGLLRLVSYGLLTAAVLALLAFVLGNERAMARLRGGGAGARGVLDEHRDATVLVAAALALLVLTLAGFSWLSVFVVLVLLGIAAWAAWAPRPEPQPDPESDRTDVAA